MNYFNRASSLNIYCGNTVRHGPLQKACAERTNPGITTFGSDKKISPPLKLLGNTFLISKLWGIC
jgi:hypothetical protein